MTKHLADLVFSDFLVEGSRYRVDGYVVMGRPDAAAGDDKVELLDLPSHLKQDNG